MIESAVFFATLTNGTIPSLRALLFLPVILQSPYKLCHISQLHYNLPTGQWHFSLPNGPVLSPRFTKVCLQDTDPFIYQVAISLHTDQAPWL